MSESLLNPTQESAVALFSRGLQGPVVMLNLLRFREVADYSASPELAPEQPISGQEAYQLYIEHAEPFVKASGGELIFQGTGGQYFIGPSQERWDLVLLVRQKSLEDFRAFASNPDYQAILGHRTAALEDSRMLPLMESSANP